MFALAFILNVILTALLLIKLSDFRINHALLGNRHSDKYKNFIGLPILAGNNSQHLDWISNFSKFLRHEARQPISQINSSLELIHLDTGISEDTVRHLDSASSSAQAVWALIEQASRAADATAILARSRPSKQNLSQIVSDVIGDFRSTYSGVEIEFLRKSSAFVFIDKVAAKEAISCVLLNAVSFADEDTIVEVDIRHCDENVYVKVLNRGPLLSSEYNDFFKPFVSTRSDRNIEHHGLGLYTTKIIIEGHGGSIWIANALDGSGVEVEFRLPVIS